MNAIPSLPLIFLLLSILIQTSLAVSKQRKLAPSSHTTNHAIILNSSVFFHNYRHTSNALAIYHSLKIHGGFTDENIVLFLADEIACNGRNPIKDSVLPFRSSDAEGRTLDLYDGYVEVDYAGEDVTVDNFLRVLQGRHRPSTPPNQKLPPIDERANLFVYITGHGGDEFFKFRDREELTARAFRLALDEMQFRKRYHKILFVTDTCQAFTLAPNTPANDEGETFPSILGGGASPSALRNVYTIGSSVKGHNSYSHHSDRVVGHSVIDRYVYNLMEYMGWMDQKNKAGNWKWGKMEGLSVKEALVDSMYDGRGRSVLMSEVGWTDHGCDVKMGNVPLSDFMVMRQKDRSHGNSRAGSVGVEILEEGVDFVTQTVREGVGEGGATAFEVDKTPKISAWTSARGEVEGWEETVVEGTNPTSPLFVLSTLVSVLVIRYSSAHLW